MELKDLVGEHLLSGLDTYKEPPADEWSDEGDAIRFVLDGVTYKAVENPDDGYRSYLRELQTTPEAVQYNFPPQKVFAKMENDDEWGKNDVLQFFDIVSSKLVLAIGTRNYDDYYPCAILEWHPENLSINQPSE